MSKTMKICMVTAICFLCYYLLMDFQFSSISNSINNAIQHRGISHIITYFFVGLPIFIGIAGINRTKNFFAALGLTKSMVTGIVYPLCFTLPMFVGFAFVFELNTHLTWNEVLIGAVAAAFFEELYFRGFLFGQLFRYTKLGFIPSVLLGALIFASGHLWQSQELSELIGIFITTFLGAVLFAWLYAEWHYNLYVAMFMHFFMNFSWMLFDVSDNALGNSYGNLFRYSTVTLAIAYTVIYKIRKGEGLAVNQQTLWVTDEEIPDVVELE